MPSTSQESEVEQPKATVSQELTAEEKVERAKQLLEKKREEKRREEEEVQIGNVIRRQNRSKTFLQRWKVLVKIQIANSASSGGRVRTREIQIVYGLGLVLNSKLGLINVLPRTRH
jgi:hypothetical protein